MTQKLKVQQLKSGARLSAERSSIGFACLNNIRHPRIVNICRLPKDARAASGLFQKRDQGDVLLSDSKEAIRAANTGVLQLPFWVSEVNIRIEEPVLMVDKVLERKVTRKAAEALADDRICDEAQRIFAEEGFRATNSSGWERVKPRFTPVQAFSSTTAVSGIAGLPRCVKADV